MLEEDDGAVREPNVRAAAGIRRGLVLLFCDVLKNDDDALEGPNAGVVAHVREGLVPDALAAKISIVCVAREGLVSLFCGILEEDDDSLDELKAEAASSARGRLVLHFCVTMFLVNPVSTADVGTAGDT